MDAPAVAVSSDGKKLAVAWMDMRSEGKDRNVYWSLATTGRFSDEQSIADDARNVQGHPSLCMDDDLNVHAAWEDAREGRPRIYCTSSLKGSKNTAVSDESEGEVSFPTIACGKVVGIAYEAGGAVHFRAIGLAER
jgi:hypothetical protein